MQMLQRQMQRLRAPRPFATNDAGVVPTVFDSEIALRLFGSRWVPCDIVAVVRSENRTRGTHLAGRYRNLHDEIRGADGRLVLDDTVFRNSRADELRESSVFSTSDLRTANTKSMAFILTFAAANLGWRSVGTPT